MFPYSAILKEAYELVLKNRFLWVFGLFLGGSSMFNASSANWVQNRRTEGQLSQVKEIWLGTQNFLTSNPKLAAAILTGGLIIVFLLILISGLSHAALIWSADELSKKENDRKQKVTLRTALSAGMRYLFPVIALQILMTVAFLAMLVFLAAPTLYLFMQDEPARGLVLLLIALAIFIPASIVFSFINLYGPIAIVLYRRSPLHAVQFAFNLLRTHLKESIILAALLAGLSFLTALAVTFALILASLPLALLAILSSWLGAGAAMYTLLGGAILIAIFCVIVFGAAFAAFQNVVWVLAVKHLVKLRKSPEKADSLAVEPAGG